MSYNFSRINNHGLRENFELNRENIRAILSESQLSIKVECLKSLNSFIFLSDGLEELSTTRASFSKIDANGKGCDQKNSLHIRKT